MLVYIVRLLLFFAVKVFTSCQFYSKVRIVKKKNITSSLLFGSLHNKEGYMRFKIIRVRTDYKSIRFNTLKGVQGMKKKLHNNEDRFNLDFNITKLLSYNDEICGTIKKNFHDF